MAGDWIKVEAVTPDKPEVHEIAAALGITAEAAVGHLFRVWIWADQQSRNGHALRVTNVTLDSVARRDGFATAMRNAGWLVGESGAVTFPNFDRHNGKTAKNRALAKDRKVTQRSREERDNSVTREEKRREEGKPTPSLRSGAVKAGGEVVPISTPKKPTPGKESPAGPAWDAYEFAYVARYRATPVRNARVNGQMANFVRCVGAEAAPGVVEFYLRHNDARYVREAHSVGMLLAHAEKLHTEWSTGQRVTVTAAQQADKLQATGDTFRKLIEESHEPQNP